MKEVSSGPYFLIPVSLLSSRVKCHEMKIVLSKRTLSLHQSQGHSEKASSFYGTPLIYDTTVELKSLTAVNHFKIVLLTRTMNMVFPQQIQRLSDVQVCTFF